MNVFVIAGALFLVGTFGWYVWLTNREAKAAPAKEEPKAEG
ncbi:MAG: hypothetical protein U0559_04475 [Anaerolineae bacterium]